jgi:hypothetical protein
MDNSKSCVLLWVLVVRKLICFHEDVVLEEFQLTHGEKNKNKSNIYF